MTPRENLLRKGLEDARDTVRAQCQNFEGTHEGQYWINRLLEINQALEHADHIKDGPSEKDIERMKQIEHVFSDSGNVVDLDNLLWMANKLKKYMGME